VGRGSKDPGPRTQDPGPQTPDPPYITCDRMITTANQLINLTGWRDLKIGTSKGASTNDALPV